MSAFERETDMRLVGLQAMGDRIGDDSSQVFEEFRYDGVSVDALYTRVNEDALEEREAAGLDEPLSSEKLGIYQWFTREESRNPNELIETSPDSERDKELMDELYQEGFLEKRDGAVAAVDVPRHVETIAVEFATTDWRQGTQNPFRSQAFTDEQWLVVDADVVEEASEALEWFEQNGIGLAALSPDGVLSVVQEPGGDGADDIESARTISEQVYSGEVF